MNKSKRKIDSDKVLEVSFLGDKVGYYYWDGRTVTLRIYIENKNHGLILEDILNEDKFFNPKTDNIEHRDGRDDFDLFLIKAVPRLIQYGFSYEIIDLKFSSRAVYMFVTEFNDGVVINDLAFRCTYDKKDRFVRFWCGERERMLKAVKILKNGKRRFEFIDGNGFKVMFYPVTMEEYRRYRDSLFINAPTLNTDEEIQGWLMSNF